MAPSRATSSAALARVEGGPGASRVGIDSVEVPDTRRSLDAFMLESPISVEAQVTSRPFAMGYVGSRGKWGCIAQSAASALLPPRVRESATHQTHSRAQSRRGRPSRRTGSLQGHRGSRRPAQLEDTNNITNINSTSRDNDHGVEAGPAQQCPIQQRACASRAARSLHACVSNKGGSDFRPAQETRMSYPVTQHIRLSPSGPM